MGLDVGAEIYGGSVPRTRRIIEIESNEPEDIVRSSFQDVIDYVLTDEDHRHFRDKMNAQSKFVDGLSSLDRWNERTVEELDQVKRDLVIQIGRQNVSDRRNYTEDELYQTGVRVFASGNEGKGPDAWWQGMVAEAALKRLWTSYAIPAVTGDEETSYQALSDIRTDMKGLDGYCLVGLGNEEVVIGIQVKSSYYVPAGEILMVDLENIYPEQRKILEDCRMDDNKINRTLETSSRVAETRWRNADRTVSIVFVFGTNTGTGSYNGWKVIMSGIDAQETQFQFAAQFDSVLSGEEYAEAEQEKETKLDWREEVVGPIERRILTKREIRQRRGGFIKPETPRQREERYQKLIRAYGDKE